VSARRQNDEASWLRESGQPRNRKQALEDMNAILEIRNGRFQTEAQFRAANHEALEQLFEVVLFLVKDSR